MILSDARSAMKASVRRGSTFRLNQSSVNRLPAFENLAGHPSHVSVSGVQAAASGLGIKSSQNFCGNRPFNSSA